MTVCKECDNPATFVEYYDAKTAKRFVCSGHTFSFDPGTHFKSIDEWQIMTNHIPQDKYNEIISLIPIVCVDVAIVYNAKVLLIKRRDEPAKGEWWLPGGRLYKGETLEHCALRKAVQETALYCEVGPMIHYASTDFGTVHSVNFCYLLFASDDRVRLDDTCLDYKWEHDDSAVWYHPYIQKCISRTFDYLQVGILGYEY